ncbi:bifunctional DNA primase/polymerase [Mycobacteroides abscessus]|uniref:bifunctional DNA primase/polymerase n=1 Tax=Mycobacteroides abscessus TaxID=36809 RepID=UPI000E68E0C1|nr:bifunctional DNA primase/polymerase [Mycobacteroides abscessus]RIS51927.1 hypothetical protein D2E46_23990 [Mycobacteroides abscessus]
MSEVPFTPAEHKAIDAKLADRRPINAAWAAGIADAFHALPLERARKRPVNRGWPTAPALTEAALAWHLDQGGNVGALLGASGERGLIAWDADNAAAAEAIEAAGYTPFAIPANALNPNHSKGRFGGRHRLWSVPAEWGVSGMELTSPRATVALANGGTVDVLAGPKFLVLPPSILCEEGHLNHYNPAEGWTPSPPPLPVEFWPDWVRPEGTPDPPAELAALRVDIRPRTAFERAEERMLPAGSRELTEQIDGVPMATWLAMDDQRYIEVLDTAGSCGCPKGRFSLQSSATGMELHDGCAYGRGVHVYSGTLAAHLAGNGENRDHMSWPDFIAGLYGRPFRDVVRDAGIELTGGREDRELDGITAEQFEADAAEQEAKGNHSAAEGLRRAAMRQREAVMEWARRNGEVFVEGPVVGAMPSQPIVAPSAAAPALSVIQGGLAAAPAIGTLGGSTAASVPPAVSVIGNLAAAVPVIAPVAPSSVPRTVPAAPSVASPAADVASEPAPSTDEQIQSIKLKSRAQLLHASEPQLLDKIFSTKQMKTLRENARLSLVSPTVKLMADLTGVLSLVPPTVTLPPIVMDSEAGLNFIHNVVGRSGAGKSTSTKVTFRAYRKSEFGVIGTVEEHPPIPRSVGSGEVIASVFAHIETDDDGNKTAVVHNPYARLFWPEITKLTAVRGRSGSTLAAELCQVWSSEQLGSDTKTETAFCDEHEYRCTTTVASQLATAGAMYDPTSTLMGLGQRVWNVSAELTEAPVEGTPEWEALAVAAPKIDPMSLHLPTFRPGPVPVDPKVHREVRVLRMRMAVEEETPELALETHTALMRLKLAVAAAIYHGESAAVTWEWWCWTEHLLEHHRRVRTACQTAVGITRVGESVEQGVKDALRKQAREATEHTTAMQRALKWARKQPMPFTASEQGRAGGRRSYREENAERLCADLVAGGLLAQVTQDVAHCGPVLKYAVTELGRTQDVQGA